MIFGKTNTPPYAADYQTNNPLFGRTTNPWDASRTPGGSAGGSAAALAAGHTSFQLGSDLGGSIRIPAANCGVFGLKPSHGIIPTRGHIPGPPDSLAEPELATLGPLGRSADDLDLGLAVLAGPDERSARAWRLELPGPRHETLGGYRIAVVFDDPYCPVDTTVVEVLTSLVATLRSAGATIEETSPPAPLSETDPLYQQTLAGVTAAFQPPQAMDFFEGMVTHADTADTNPLTQWARWNLQTVREWSFAREARAQLKARWAEFFNQYNALLCPVSNVPAISHADSPQAALRRSWSTADPRPTSASRFGVAWRPLPTFLPSLSRQG